MSTDERIVERVRAGTPLFLLLGQRHAAVETGTDPILSLMARRAGIETPDVSAFTYAQVFCSRDRPIDAEVVSWLANQVAAVPLARSLLSIAGVAWNGVFTSSPDGRLNSAFRSGLRDVQPVYSSAISPLQSRSRSRLCVTYLFGALDRTERDEAIPTSRFELAGRRLTANQLLARLSSQITPLGTLIIDDFDVEDWLSTEMLYGTLQSLTPGQAIICAPSANLVKDHFVSELLRSGVLLAVDRPLSEVLDEARDHGRLPELSLDDSDDKASVFIGGKLTPIPKDLYFRLGASGRIVDHRALAAPAPLSQEGKYAVFRNFLGESTVSTSWDAFARQLVFRREFWTELNDVVSEFARDGGVDAPVVLLHGQSGSGKSTTLAWLAFQIASQRTLPTIFFERHGPRPDYNDLDEFCRWAEEAGAPCTIIIWDGMAEPDTYQYARRILASRGRRVVWVASYFTSPVASESDSYLTFAKGIARPTVSSLKTESFW